VVAGVAGAASAVYLAFLPLIRAHVSAAESEQFGQMTFERFSNDEKLIATRVLEDVATREGAEWFTGGLPLPITLMWRYAGRRRYARFTQMVLLDLQIEASLEVEPEAIRRTEEACQAQCRPLRSPTSPRPPAGFADRSP
jgi:hypothetical protein